MAVGTGGAPVFMPPGGLSGAPYGTLMGRPVIPVEYCATVGTEGDIILADLSQYLMIDKGGINAASSMHVRFIYDEMAYRFIYRVDGQPIWNSALTPKNGSNTLSPFVTLATRS
jgi:HK97 family phage major capsid protein